MTADETITAIREIIARCTCGERELLELLEAEAAGWAMRLWELDQKED